MKNLDKQSDCMDRTPDLETETFRAWAVNKEDVSLDKEDIKIEYEGMSFGLTGFNQVTNKDNKLVFALKFKHKDRMVIYYIPDGNSEEDTNNITKFMEQIKVLNLIFGYKWQDVRETLKAINNQKHILEKMGDKHGC